LSGLPSHIEDAISAVTKLHAEHHQNSTRMQCATRHIIGALGRPVCLGVLTVLLVGWPILNFCLWSAGYRPIDLAPFPWLSIAVSIVSLYIVILILATQQHDDELALRCQKLTLELAVMTEQKSTKIIQLLEESRRDNPLIPNRLDDVAAAMSESVAPSIVLQASQQEDA